MINKIKNIANTEDKKRLLSNFFSLSVLQGANYILPLITLPYLVRVLGVEGFGIIALATSVIMYLGILVDYGFNTTATREISINKHDLQKVSDLYSVVMIIKFVLLIVSFLILTLMLFTFDFFAEYKLIYFLTFGILIGQYLFPVFLFQGMEQMKYITYINLTSKLIFTISLFIFIKNQDDLYLVPLLTSLGFIVAGLFSIYFVKIKFNIFFNLPKLTLIKIKLKEGWNIFLAALSGNIYGQGNIIILGLLTTPLIVGYYSIAQKLTVSIVSIFQVFSQAIMPYFSSLITGSKIQFIRQIGMTLKYSAIINFLLIGFLLVTSDYIYFLISGENNPIGLYTFSFWLIVAFFTIFNTVLHPILIATNKDKYMAKFYLIVSGLFLIYSPILTILFSYKGMLVSMLIVEVSIFIFSVFGVYKGVSNK